MIKLKILTIFCLFAFSCSESEKSKEDGAKAKEPILNSLITQYNALKFDYTEPDYSYFVNQKYLNQRLIFVTLLSDVYEFNQEIYLTGESMSSSKAFLKVKIGHDELELLKNIGNLAYIVLEDVKFKKFDFEFQGRMESNYVYMGDDQEGNDIQIDVPISYIEVNLSYSYFVTGKLLKLSSAD